MKMKTKGIAMMIVLFLITNFVFSGVEDTFLFNPSCYKAQARTKIVSEPGKGFQSGRYVYYAFEMGGVRMGIMRYDVKKKIKKEIFSYLYEGEETNGFYNITVKGKYIYAEWDISLGTSVSETYIYRIAKDGSSSKRLALGTKPVIIGNRIYYEKCRLESDGVETEAVATGAWYSMKLNGTDKKKAAKPQFRIMSGNIYENKRTDTIRKYQYYIQGNSLYRETVKTGNKKKLMSCKNGISEFYVTGNYILVLGTVKASAGNEWLQYDSAAFIIDRAGKHKKKLASWIPAE